MSIPNDNKRNGFSFSNLLVLFCAAYRAVFNGWIVHPSAWTCILFSICILHQKKNGNILDFIQIKFLQLVFMKHSLDSRQQA